MTTKEHEQYIKELKSLTAKLLKSKEESQRFYKSAGIHTNSGNLTSGYKVTSKIGFTTAKDNR